MRLTLKVRSYCAQPVADTRTQTFDTFPIHIGRSLNSDYVLDDESRYISSNHAVVVLDNNRLCIQDTSSNGVFMNGNAEPIGQSGTQVLNNNDSISIGDYTLQISIGSSDAFSSDRDEANFGDVDPNAYTAIASATPANGPNHDWTPPSQSNDSSDPFDDIWVDEAVKSTSNQGIPENQEKAVNKSSDWANWEINEPSHIAAQPPPSRSPAPISTPMAEPMPVQRSAPAPQHQSEGHSESNILAYVLQAAGMNPSEFSHLDQRALAIQLGELLSTSVDSLVMLLHSRTELKNAVRSEVTTLARVNNNPLKFATSSQDALKKLLSSSQHDAYLDANSAVTEAVDDLKAHQVAMLDGMKSAMKATLLRFNPSLLAQKLEEKGSFGSNIPINREAKLWEMFTEQYAAISEEAMNDFSEYFGKEFRTAYEKRIRELGRTPVF